MNKIQIFEPGTYVTNGYLTGIVKGYSDDMSYFQDRFSQEGAFIHLYIGFEESEFIKDASTFNDGWFRPLNDTEIDEANKRLLEGGYKWDSDSKQVIETKEIASTDNNENHSDENTDNEQKFKQVISLPVLITR